MRVGGRTCLFHSFAASEFGFLSNAANTGLAALEVTPGSLLRITSYTGDKHFSRAAVSLDPVGTAGHLVSMVVADGVVNTPTALLANHIQSSLASAIAKEGSYIKTQGFLLFFLEEHTVHYVVVSLQ